MSETAQELAGILFLAFSTVGFAARLFVPSVKSTGTTMLLTGQVGLLLLVLPDSLRDHAIVLAIVCAVAGAVALMLAHTLDRKSRTWLLAAIAATVAVRVPVDIGEERFILALPLYAVLAVSGLRLLLDDARAKEQDAAAEERRVLDGATVVDATVAILATLSLISAFWALDYSAALEKAALVTVPFSLLYVVVRTWLGRVRSLAPLAVALVGSMAVCAIVGIYQHHARTVWQNPKVIVANQFAPDFRTNSIFWDPNIYGRYLAFALIALFVGMLLRGRSARWMSGAVVVATILVAGLWYTYSQSSFAALAAACATMAALVATRPVRRLLAVVALCGLVALPVAANQLEGRDRASRAGIARKGIVLASYRPLGGVGFGSFEEGIRQLSKERGAPVPALTASHTTPVTVLAELGALGFVAYLMFIAAAGTTALTGAERARRSAFDTTIDPDAAIHVQLYWWACGAFALVTAHSMFYAGFFEDPLMWASAAILAGTSTRTVGSRDAAARTEAVAAPN